MISLCEAWGHQHLLLEVTCCVLGPREGTLGLELGFGSGVWVLALWGRLAVALGAAGQCCDSMSLLPQKQPGLEPGRSHRKQLAEQKQGKVLDISSQHGAGSVPLDVLWDQLLRDGCNIPWDTPIPQHTPTCLFGDRLWCPAQVRPSSFSCCHLNASLH